MSIEKHFEKYADTNTNQILVKNCGLTDQIMHITKFKHLVQTNNELQSGLIINVIEKWMQKDCNVVIKTNTH